MARIRTIKPEFPQSESMGNVSRDARLCFILMWTLADDSGRLRGNSRMLASLLFPYDDDAPGRIDSWLDELDREGCVIRYVAEGATYIQIAKWLIHQKIDKPSPSKIPEFDGSSRILANVRERSSEDQGSRIKDQGEDQGITREKKFDAKSFLEDLGVDSSVAKDWLDLRKKKRASQTETALNGIADEAKKAGMALNDALKVACRRGWQGFEAEWLTNGNARASPVKSWSDANAETIAILTGRARDHEPDDRTFDV
jgi:hypothetical protein